MDIKEIANYYLKNENYPGIGYLAKEISLSDNIISKIKSIRDMTNKDGRERALNIYLAFDELIVSDYILGSEHNVVTRERISAKLIPHKIKDMYIKKVYVNDKEVCEKIINEKEARNMNKSIIFLSNFHTHPVHYEMSLKTWGFFSDVDLSSFSSNKGLLTTGLITKSYWLLVKTAGFRGIDINSYVTNYNLIVSNPNPSFEKLILLLKSFSVEVYNSNSGRYFEKF